MKKEQALFINRSEGKGGVPMKWNRALLSKLMLTGTLAVTVAAVPESAEVSNVHATTDKTVTTSVDDIRQKLLTAMNSREAYLRFVYQGQTKSLKAHLKNALDQAMDSDPYIHYTIASYSYDYRGTSSSADVTVRLTYRETAEQTRYVDRRVKDILAAVIKPGMSSHEKVKAINDWVVLNLKYDTSLKKYTAYDGLSTGSTVCQGYSLLTYKLLKSAGIENKIVEGTAYPSGSGQGQLHAWNLVKLDGKWYHLDTTWNDPVPNREGKVSYTHYLRSDAQMAKDHTWVKSYPAASTSYSTTLNALASKPSSKAAAYRALIQALEYDLHDPKAAIRTYDQLHAKVNAAVKKNQQELVFRYDGEERGLLALLQELQRKAGVGTIRYYHDSLEDSDDLKVHISW
ncbi:transglutaminase-like protein [Paenibacillus algicola]|uniref:Transglutaminase-like protein n=1 Tax=Paenibacillus algicola TaxID=2565926 RepID=A0A4V1G4D1_9BACL|nr:transglutaminase domain-containing protein [Paenibacillus algicola]QCT04274.1 transglutaminase-like protein [Paenibacillus algicola]